jgi:DNA-binding HxlR family transcriptional regulator
VQHEPTATPLEDDDRTDQLVLNLLVEPDQPWSEEEIIRELTGVSRIAVIDSLARLRGKGVVHRLNEFAFMTRPARESYRLTGGI